jgi:methanogenic corrinoid protein MtbC1
MNDQAHFVAGMLRSGSAALSGFAANALLESQPRFAQSLGLDSFAVWKSWFADRIEDLIAALSTSATASFATQMTWAQTLMVARGLSRDDFRATLDTLGDVLTAQLPAEARETIEPYFAAARDACARARESDYPALQPDTPDRRLAAEYLLALLEGDRQRANDLLLDTLSAGKSVVEIYQQILAPALVEVGRMWMAGEIGIAEEHFVTTSARDTLIRLRLHAASQPANGRTVLAAAVAGNQHDLGLQMVVDLFELAGWRAVNLGANVPVSDVVRAAVDFSADLLLLSAALPAHLPAVRDSIAALRASSAGGVKVLVGGVAFQASPQLAEQLGADGCANSIDEALALADQLLKKSS